jgi:hypothetical protein
MKRIPLTRGEYAIVDDEDYVYLSRFKWYNKTSGVQAKFRKQNKDYFWLNMWQLLVDTAHTKGPYIKEIVYKDKNRLNLQKDNLLLVEIPNTLHLNKKLQSKNGLEPTSYYKGVSKKRKKSRGKEKFYYYPPNPWRAEIRHKGKVILKYFATEKEAALWYNEKAREFYGEFAYQNKID